MIRSYSRREGGMGEGCNFLLPYEECYVKVLESARWWDIISLSCTKWRISNELWRLPCYALASWNMTRQHLFLLLGFGSVVWKGSLYMKTNTVPRECLCMLMGECRWMRWLVKIYSSPRIWLSFPFQMTPWLAQSNRPERYGIPDGAREIRQYVA